MVSLQAYLSQGDQRIVMSPNFETTFSNSKKRKWQETGDQHQNQAKQSKRSQEQADDIELNLDAPLPQEWQRCLDIKSGQIHFYNSWTHKRTSKDPRSAPEPRPPSPSLSLDLELNLSSSSNHVVDHDHQVQPKHGHQFSNIDHQHKTKSSSSSSSSSSCSPSWISLDVDRQEMVAAVCMRCHMLVMMCKATPSCPNCKFVYPQGQGQATSASSSSSLISSNKPAGLRLLCCKD